MSEQPLQITELDKALREDASGQIVKRYSEQLSDGKRKVRMTLDAGVSSEEHARLTTLIAAYDAGLDALPKIWASHHA